MTDLNLHKRDGMRMKMNSISYFFSSSCRYEADADNELGSLLSLIHHHDFTLEAHFITILRSFRLPPISTVSSNKYLDNEKPVNQINAFDKAFQ